MTLGDHVVVTGGIRFLHTGIVDGTEDYRYGDRVIRFIVVRFADGSISQFHPGLLSHAASA